MARRKNTTSLDLNGLRVTVTNFKAVSIKDKMDNCDEREAALICSYLFQEGFLKESEEIVCEIIKP